MGALWFAVLAVASTAVVFKGSELLERTSEELATYYGLPAVVQGAVVAAVGSSFPELASAVLATLLHGEFGLGVGAIVGSAIFNVLVIPALSSHASGSPIGADRDVVYKEALFYMLAVSVTVIVFAFASIYYPAPESRLAGTVTRPLAAMPIALYVLYVFIQYQDTADHDARPDTSVDPRRTWAKLAVSLLLIVVAVEGLVRAALGFGALLGTSPFLWGLTVVAIGTSLPDAVVSVRAARADRGITSLGNVLGSNTFDLLVAVPAGVVLAGPTVVDFAAALPMFAFLTFATVVLFTALRTDMALSRREGWFLIGTYGVFLAWMVGETLDLFHLVPGA